MSKKDSGSFWRIKGHAGPATAFDIAVRSWRLTNVMELLKRLAARHLSDEEIIACSLRGEHRSKALDVQFPDPRSSDRHSISIGAGPWYTASVWTESELIEAGIPILKRGL